LHEALQDVLRAELEVLELENQLVQLRQELETAQARLARRLHVSPETPVRAVEQLPTEQFPSDIHRLYEQAVAARPELHAQLADVMRERHNVDLARLEYFPNVRLSGMWMGMAMPDRGVNGRASICRSTANGWTPACRKPRRGSSPARGNTIRCAIRRRRK